MYDLVVIGNGSGGLHLTNLAARVGARVALIDEHAPAEAGWIGACVPSKGLLQSARLLHEIRGAGEFGVHVEPPKVDLAAVLDRLRRVFQSRRADHSDETLAARGIDIYHGKAAFEAYDTVLLDGNKRIEGQRFVIATGSRPAPPTFPGSCEVWLPRRHFTLVTHAGAREPDHYRRRSERHGVRPGLYPTGIESNRVDR